MEVFYYVKLNISITNTFTCSSFFITEKDPVIKLGNLKVTDGDAFSIQKYKNLNTSFRNLKSLILLTYYDDDVNIQTCDEKLLSATLKGNHDYFLAFSSNKMKK